MTQIMIAAVYCPICTHTVEVEVLVGRKQPQVKPGQKCPRCASCIDAGCVVSIRKAA